MWQELFRIPYFHIPVYGYGVMLVIGFFCAMELTKFLARHSRIDPEVFANAALVALITGVIGARLSHVLENLPVYTDPARTGWENFKDAINVSSGGLTYYGGFLLAFPSVLAYGWYRRVPLRLGMDIVAPCLMIGLGFGRIGCFLNGCCYGADCDVPGISVRFPYGSNAYIEQYQRGVLKVPSELLGRGHDGALYPLQRDVAEKDPTLKPIADVSRANGVQPAQLYSAFTGFLLGSFLLAYFTLPHIPGRVFAIMMVLEGICRYLLEMLRMEPPRFHVAGLPLTLGMATALGLVVLGALLWLVFGWVGPGNVDAPLELDSTESRSSAVPA